ncbi:MAG: transposase, partial [Gammaproteobacteria bacterium]|nr:transposase [Gammaproteobacteria bacterium]
MAPFLKNSLLPPIPLEEQTPTVRLLIAIIEQQQSVIDTQKTTIEQLQLQINQLRSSNERQQETLQKQQAQIEALKAEMARLKKLPKKPIIRPSTLPKDDEESDHDDSDDTGASGQGGGNHSKGKNAKSRKRKKKLTIHKSKIIKPDNLPRGSRLLGYEDYTIQELLIQPHNTRYRLARYRTPEGKTLMGVLPEELQGSHFGIILKSHILYQYYHQRVTQPLILQQLTEWGIDISSGQISRILTEEKERFHTEKDALLTAGINNSDYIHVDDTGSRHDGKNGYCTHIGNDAFAWFSSTRSKSRINFLALLRGAAVDYTINPAALDYMCTEGLPQGPLAAIGHSEGQTLDDKAAWKQHLQQLKITNKRHIRIATEGALLGTLAACGFPPDLVIISDDAGQFNVLLHALCWVHADRVFQRILPLNDIHTKQLNWVHTQIWEIYADLKRYKCNQDPDLKKAVNAHFDELCRTKTTFATLNQALKRLARNKKELLLVLERPDIPLHNNLSERDIREYVIKRKISGSTRSKNGRRCRDTFTSLKKTCKKQGIAFWEFLLDRLRRDNRVPYLPDLLCGNVCLVPSS